MHARLVAAVLACGLAAACDTCPFQNVGLRNFSGTLEAGAFAVHDVNVTAEDRLELDVSNATAATAGARVDVWVTAASCHALFTDPYPLPSGALPAAQCAVILGPVAPNSVSGRVKVSPALYRVYAYAWTTNTSTVSYGAGVGVWGQTCRALTQPR